MMPRFFLIFWLAMAAFSYAQQQDPAKEWHNVTDPTALTTAALERSISALKELVGTRLDAIDRATQLLAARADKVPSEVDTKVTNLQALHNEKFLSVEKQFEERDTRTDKLADAGQLAIKDALQAAKELVASQNASNEKAIIKSEGNTTKLLENLDVKIIDLRDRLTAIENKGVGQTTERTAQQTDNSFMVAASAVIVAIILGLAGIAMKLFAAPTRR